MKKRSKAAGKKKSAANGKGKSRAPLPLSPREEEILKLLTEGTRTGAMAKGLGISEKTARTHVQNILRKLGLHSRIEAVVYAFKNK